METLDILESIQKRKSIRAYRPLPVSKEILGEILRIATRSPSCLNTQPWEFTVVSGDVLDGIRRENVARFLSGEKPRPDFLPNPGFPREEYQGVYRQRLVSLAVVIFRLLGIEREDRAKRSEWQQRGFGFFDAPAAIIISVDKTLDVVSYPYTLFDIGAIANTISLAALKYGLGTCIEIQGISYPDVIRKFTRLPESKRIVIGIAIGYPDWDYPANSLNTDREPVENITTWHGF
ncbi:MAG: nitroreductase [Bacillota bacterium]